MIYPVVPGAAAVSRVLNFPPVRAFLQRRYERQFASWPTAFRGIYRSFHEAARAAPLGRLGYDFPEMATMYQDRLDRVYPSDYPAMFWLQRAFDQGARSVFDFGGHVGIAYYAYKTRLRFPSGVAWVVCDLPSIIEGGRSLARERGSSDLSFTTELSHAASCDVFCAQGVLQYVETPLAELLRGLARMPPRLLLTKIPLTDGAPFVTLQNTWYTFNPFVVFNRQTMLQQLTALGYELIDAWSDPEHSCIIPFHPERWVRQYSGLYLRQAGASLSSV